MDARAPRDGRVLEELGTYDPMIPETDARAVLDGERIAHWLSVGAQPTEKVRVLIKKYGPGGTRLAAQQTALDRLAQSRRRPEPPAPMPKTPAAEKAAEQPAEKEEEQQPREESPAAETENETPAQE